MKNSPLQNALQDLDIARFVQKASDTSLARMIAEGADVSIAQERPERLPRLSFLYEAQGIEAYKRWMALGSSEVVSKNDKSDVELARKTFKEAFEKTFFCWRALLNLEVEHDVPSTKGIELIAQELNSEPLSPKLTLAFRLAVSGVLAQRSAEVRLELRRLKLNGSNRNNSWRDQVLINVFEAFVLLTRKSEGWSDIDLALQLIAELRQFQGQYEDDYIDGNGDHHKQVSAAVDLVGNYHLAQLVAFTAEYLQTGQPGATVVNGRLEKHRERALAAFAASKSVLMSHLVELLTIGCHELVQNSIWTHSALMPERVREFITLLANRGRPNPIIELWPAQQEALLRNVLSTYHRAILVEMPTSAGKTLLAKFAIVQSRTLNPQGTIAYIVPTRALVNQVTFDLRSDFSGMNPPIRVEQAVPAFELDPTEDVLLQTPPDVLVTTPEKLDLLIRKDHSAAKNLSMIVADEAHNIGDKERGARLELLLGTIKRDRPKTRFLLLSPWLPNDEELLAWLGERESLPPITIDWKPSNRIVGAVGIKGKGKTQRVIFETLPAADNSDIKEKLSIPLSSDILLVGSKNINRLTKETVNALVNRGSILVLCRGQGTATKRAIEIAAELTEQEVDPQIEVVCRYLETEIGAHTSLIDCLRKRVAYHHAGISHEARWLLEVLVKKEAVKVVCGTTTLAQGVNFPLATVIVETLKKGDAPLTYQDFWNIAGRAGRALMDTVGLVAFPTPSKPKKDAYVEFLRDEAKVIASQLAQLVDRADEIAGNFNLKTVFTYPGLSELLQFLAHAMKIAGRTDLANEVEDIMRASLVYHQIRKRDQVAASNLLKICRSYLADLEGKRQVEGLLDMADQTGFATPSVLKVLAHTRQDSTLGQADQWHPDTLFGQNLDPLTRRIEVIGELPEIQLGAGTHAPFSPALVAAILRDWVQGFSLDELSSKYITQDISDRDERISKFSRYLFSQLISKASWGLGALEGICLSNVTDQEWQEVGYVPSMVFYGVKKKEAIWLRMVGVPRALADSMATLWQQKHTEQPSSYDAIRQWVDSLSHDEWKKVVPQTSPLTPQDCRILWETLSR